MSRRFFNLALRPSKIRVATFSTLIVPEAPKIASVINIPASAAAVFPETKQDVTVIQIDSPELKKKKATFTGSSKLQVNVDDKDNTNDMLDAAGTLVGCVNGLNDGFIGRKVIKTTLFWFRKSLQDV
jgi:hypothetical protein